MLCRVGERDDAAAEAATGKFCADRTCVVRRGYERIEKFALVKVGFFSVLTICAAAVLLRRPGAITGPPSPASGSS